MIPTLEQIWQVVADAAQELDAELVHPISLLVEEAITALDRRSFKERIAAMAEQRRSNPIIQSRQLTHLQEGRTS
jgi:hypothetical protein